jgi:hypothetical protein
LEQVKTLAPSISNRPASTGCLAVMPDAAASDLTTSQAIAAYVAELVADAPTLPTEQMSEIYALIKNLDKNVVAPPQTRTGDTELFRLLLYQLS